jgi:lycopene cyclase domain-containing protein
MEIERFTYLLMELGWALPVIGLLFLRGWRMLWRARLALVLASFVPTLLLCLADSLALHNQIWLLNPAKITGLHLGNLPVEEIIFFGVTNLIIVQSVLIMLSQRRHKILKQQTEKNLLTSISRPD